MIPSLCCDTIFVDCRAYSLVIWLLICQVFNPFIVAFGEQERQGAGGGDADEDGARPPAFGGGYSLSSRSLLEGIAQQPSGQEATSAIAATATAVGARAPSTANTAAAAASTTTPRTLRQEGETQEPAIPSGGGLLAGGLANALPANVGLMTLMQLVDGKSQHNDKGPWEELSHAVRPAGERSGRLTLLVRKQRHACQFLSVRGGEIWLPPPLPSEVPLYERGRQPK